MTPDSTKIILTVEPRSKGVPYPAEDHGDSTNIGFQDLKGDEAAARAIPEVQDSPVLRDALVALNAACTPFFTVGCEKSLNVHEGKYWKRGYLKFAYNYAEIIGDATAYFPLFFHFSKAAREFASNNSVQFLWELQEARFKKIGVGGFTCCVWITNGDYDTSEECEKVWTNGLKLLTDFLLSVKAQKFAPMFGPQARQ